MTARAIDDYLALVTSEHRNKPKFIASLTAVLQPLVDSQVILETLSGKYDLDLAVGVQLDAVGLWVGASRQLRTPLAGVYFSLDTDGLGFDEGVWKGPFDPDTGLVSLPDEQYRVLIRARIANNHWDGTIPDAYEIWDIAFAGTGYSIIIQDHQNMSMTIGLVGSTGDALIVALLTGGYLDIKPAGVRIAGYVIPSVPSTPFFGLDVENDSVSGFDVGSWAIDI